MATPSGGIIPHKKSAAAVLLLLGLPSSFEIIALLLLLLLTPSLAAESAFPNSHCGLRASSSPGAPNHLVPDWYC